MTNSEHKQYGRMSEACRMNIEGTSEDIFSSQGAVNWLTPLIRQSRLKRLQARKKVEQDRRLCLCNSTSFLCAEGGGRCISGKQTCGLVLFISVSGNTVKLLYASKLRTFIRLVIISYSINVTESMLRGTQSATINGFAFFLSFFLELEYGNVY